MHRIQHVNGWKRWKRNIRNNVWNMNGCRIRIRHGLKKWDRDYRCCLLILKRYMNGFRHEIGDRIIFNRFLHSANYEDLRNPRR